MKNQHSRFGPGLVALMFALPALALANVPVPSAFGVAAPGYLAFKSAGIAFLGIVLIEAVVLKFAMKLTWAQSLGAAAIANAISSLVGVVAAVTVCLFFLVIVSLSFPYELRRRRGYQMPKAIAIGLTPMLVLPWYILTFHHGHEAWAYWGGIGIAFVLSVVIEAVTIDFVLKKGTQVPKVMLANVPSYFALVAFMLALGMGPSSNPIYSPDYFYTVGMKAAGDDRPLEALRMVEMMRDNLSGDEFGYRALSFQFQIAEKLLSRGHQAEAASIAKWIRENVQSWEPDWISEDEIENRLLAIEQATSPTLTRSNR